jgi:Ca2+-binding RTX toxin-like protein
MGGAGADYFMFRMDGKFMGSPFRLRIDGTDEELSNVLVGGEGNDTLMGGAGIDLLEDFNPTEDMIVLSKETFTGLSNGFQFEVIAGGGVAGAVASQAQIVYDNSTGALYYNPDGGNATQFATLTNAPELTKDRFMIV